ncbi:MAG: hypothetical protein H7039_20965 [Bryobacteraceae bacterium]|nr:hypothetical protein [Bryobacteraceae bacterium]
MAVVNSHQAGAILWAQWRTVWNYTFRYNRLANAFMGLFLLLWYGVWAAAAWGLAVLTANPAAFRETLQPLLPATFLLIFLYWQLVPLVMVSSGMSLDMAKILVYPIPQSTLFTIEALLRLTTAVEMVLVTIGLFAGLLLNPDLPWWSPLILIPFAAFNTLISAGLRDLFARLLALRGIREVLIFLFVLATVAPQVLLANREVSKASLWAAIKTGWGEAWPWTSAARLAEGQGTWFSLSCLAVALLMAWLFARGQFERSLRFDAAEQRASPQAPKGRSLMERLYSLPDRFFPDPIGVLVGKEVRSLSRSPRFRLLFLMGFSFGLFIWLPLVLNSSESSPVRTNYLTVVSAYALLLLGDALFWNNLGMDRTAAQIWFVAPVPFASVLKAKNLAAAFFVLLEVSMVALACKVFRFPVSWSDVAETLAVITVLTVILISAGNIVSMRFPRAVDPAKSWQSSGGRSQVYLLVVYPFASLPILLAYGARYSFEAEWAFWAVIAIDFILALILYMIALESATEAAAQRKEQIIASLSQSQSPVAG